MSLYASFNDSTCTLSATGPFNSDSKEMWQCRNSRGQCGGGGGAGREEVKASRASKSPGGFPSDLSAHTAHCPYLPRPPSSAFNHLISLSVLEQSRCPTEMSLQTQNSQPTVPLPQDSYLTCLPGKQLRKRYGKILQIHKSGIPEGLERGKIAPLYITYFRIFTKRKCCF